MFDSIVKDIRREFSIGNVVTRLILINVFVFIAVNATSLILNLSNQGEVPPVYRDIVNFFCVSSDIWHNLTHPWVFITSIFLHEGLWHLLWNMLFLYWFGRIVGDLLGDRRVLPIYLLGGVFGGIIFWASAQVLPYLGGQTGYLLGASGAVMAIVVVSGMIAPDYSFRLLLIGDVKLKYIVMALILIDLFAIGGYNTGGHFAHIGGIIMGWIFVSQLRSGNDWSEGVNNVVDKVENLFRAEKVPATTARQTRLVVKRNYKKKDTSQMSPTEVQSRVDSILDKIKDKGYNSLTDEERDFLHNASSQ